MKASEIIAKLQQEIELNGDLGVFICQDCADEDGECTLVETIDTVLNYDRTPAFIRFGDFID